MLEGLDRTLIAEMARLVDLDRDLSLEDAGNRVLYLANEEGVYGLEERLERLRETLSRHAVLNPEWLEADGLRVHFFLSNGRAGFLDQVVHSLETDRVGISQYLLYGDWDSLIVLNGSDNEANALYNNLRAGTDEDPVRFSAGEVLVEYRHAVKPITAASPKINLDTINALAANYDDPALSVARDEFLASGHILGPAWTSGGESPYPVIAYIGILLRGRASIAPAELRSAMLGNDVLSQTLVHLFRIVHGTPFHYFAKLACRSMTELDTATNALAFMKLGDVRFEGRTLVVAAGTDRFPVYRPANVSGLAVGPDFEGIMRAATVVYEGLGAEERKAFNALDDNKQIAVVRVLAELQQRASAGTWDGETDLRIRSALATFSRECVSSSDGGNFTGAVIEMTAAVEGLAKRLISRLAYSVYGRNPSKMQRELQLPTSKFRNLSLGKAAQALQVASSHQDFSHYGDQLADRWIERLDRFTESRNRWAHDDIDLRGLELLDEAHRVLAEALSLIGWLSSSIESVRQQPAEQQEESPEDTGELRLSDRPERGLSVFVSHASQDKRIASRVAMGLKAFDYDTWYDDWELLPGDSIIDRIEVAISQTDVLLVLLSKSSVGSKWVRRELSAGLARQLSGKGVMVIPVVVEDCEIPDMLANTKYVDLRGDFERGFRQLADALAARKARIMGERE
jgi:TIR domain